MSIRDNGIEWEENKDSTIEWDEIKDNLQIFKARKEDFIDLGNPFQSPKPSLERPEMKIPSKTAPSRKLVFGCIATLLLLSGFLFLRGAYLNSVIEMSEAWEVSYAIDIDYTNNFKPIQYQISMNPGERINDPVKFSIDSSYEREIIPGNERQILYGAIGGDLPREILFYRDSLFGKKVIDSLEISLPSFFLDTQNNKMHITNHTAYTFFVLSEKNHMTVLQPGEKLLLDVLSHQNVEVSLVDLKTGCIYNIRVWVRIHGH
jgi:hypothetical protein